MTVAKASTGPVTVRLTDAWLLSLVVTVAPFVRVRPPNPSVLTLILMLPSAPGGISLAYETAVQPQAVLTPRISRGAAPSFLTTKS